MCLQCVKNQKRIFSGTQKFPARIFTGASPLKILPFRKDTMLLKVQSLPLKIVFDSFHNL